MKEPSHDTSSNLHSRRATRKAIYLGKEATIPISVILIQIGIRQALYLPSQRGVETRVSKAINVFIEEKRARRRERETERGNKNRSSANVRARDFLSLDAIADRSSGAIAAEQRGCSCAHSRP